MQNKVYRRSKNRRMTVADQDRQDFISGVKRLNAVTRKTRRKKAIKWVVLLLFVLGSCVGTAYFYQELMERFFYNNTDYNLARIEIEGEAVLTEEEILAVTGLKMGVNLFCVDLGEVEKEIRKVPELMRVCVTRELPETIRVEMEAREPVAWVKGEGKDGGEQELLVDDEVVMYKPHRVKAENYGLPVISGVRVGEIEKGDVLLREDLREALSLMQTLRYSPKSSLSVRGVDVSKGYCMEVVDAKGMKVLFDIGDYAGQLERLQKLLDYSAESGRVLESVNLIPKRNTPVRFVMTAPSLPARGEMSKTKR